MTERPKCCHCQRVDAEPDGYCSECAKRFHKAYGWRRIAALIHPDNDPAATRH